MLSRIGEHLLTSYVDLQMLDLRWPPGVTQTDRDDECVPVVKVTDHVTGQPELDVVIEVDRTVFRVGASMSRVGRVLPAAVDNRSPVGHRVVATEVLVAEVSGDVGQGLDPADDAHNFKAVTLNGTYLRVVESAMIARTPDVARLFWNKRKPYYY